MFRNFAHISHTIIIMRIFKSIKQAIEDLGKVSLTVADLNDARHDIISVLLVHASYKKGELNEYDPASSYFPVLTN